MDSDQRLRFDVAGHTDIGAVRKANEDSVDWYLSPNRETALAVVADGMGGHAGGAKASQMAIEVFVATLAMPLTSKKPIDPEKLKNALYTATEQAHDSICQAREEQPEYGKMGTTLVAIWAQHDHASILHVGDSRCYRIRPQNEHSRLEQLTRDDSVVQSMVEDGTISAEEAEISPYRNMLTQAVGSDGGIIVHQLEVDVEAGDLFLLCSDGLYSELSSESILEILNQEGALDSSFSQSSDSSEQSSPNLKRISFKLTEAAKAAGGHDNISVILLRSE
ncbi:PP2C family protein-serine/threonine phosphatase [Hahella ganghwensis]|uniref:PP2C family protein-serine/threonine phosphatase n=1 Tax=Hahella ganghwensis TaxID=286420 RepID=UPI0003723B12|nr:protein phosphatase 2C domain-containing protein [Hahella ganghwensis]